MRGRSGAWRMLAVVLIGLGWVALATPPALLSRAVPDHDRPRASRLPWLSVADHAIVDEQGRRVVLRGFNTTALLDWPTQPVAPFEDSDAELIKRAGFNVVRLPIAWSRLEPSRGVLDNAYLDEVAAMVAMLNAHDLYVVIDMHMALGWSPALGGAGAPHWAVVPLVPHVRFGLAGDWTDSASPAVQVANAYFWVADDWQADLRMVWRAVAARFRDVSGVVAYDLFNEPNSSPLPPHVFEGRWMWPFYVALIEAVSEVDPNHPFVVEAPLILHPPVVPLSPRMLPLDRPNLIYSPHVYTGSVVQPLYPDDPQAVVRLIQDQIQEAKQLPAPAWWGEFGVDTGKPFAADWTDLTLDALDRAQAGWAWWQWRQDWGWGVRNGAGDFTDYNVLRRLARPYVTAAPAGVWSHRSSGIAGQLSLVVMPEHADLPIEVSWSTLTLARPRVTGSCVQSARFRATEARLVVTATPRAGCLIEVTAATDQPYASIGRTENQTATWERE